MDTLRLSQFPSVAANAIATLATSELEGMSVHGLVFEQGGTTFTKAQIDAMKIRLDGKNLIESISGSQLQGLNDYAGLPDTTNYLFHWFGDPTARTIRGQHLGDLDLSIYRSALEIEVEIGAATAPTLQVYAIVGPPKMEMGLGYNEAEAATFRAMVRTIIQPAGAINRKQYVVGLGTEHGARLRNVAFFNSNLTSVEFKKNGVVKHDDIAVALNSAIQAEHARVPQSGLYVMDRIVDGNQGEAESTVRAAGKPWPMQVLVSTSAGDTITTYADVHTMHPLL